MSSGIRFVSWWQGRPILRLALGVVAVIALVAAPVAAEQPDKSQHSSEHQQTGGEQERDDNGQTRTVDLQLLAINDFHGALESRKLGSRPIGGAAVLASYMDQWEADAKNSTNAKTIRVAAGDLVGASPPISALLQDEPTIQALDLMDFRYSAPGNHEFDEGLTEFRRLANGGCHPATGCFKGAGFEYLAANVVDKKTGEPVFAPYAIERVDGIPVGFIGVVLKATPTVVTPSGVAGLEFLDEAATVNRYVQALKDEGVETIVVLIHQGGRGTRSGGPITGEIVPIVEAIDDEVDVVVSGHSHQGYWGTIDSKLVTQAYSNGTAFADIDLTLDRKTGEVVAKRANIVDTFADVAPGTEPDKSVARLVQKAADAVAPRISAVVGTAADAITRAETAAGESELGNLIADAQRWKAGTQVAFMNAGGIRADLDAGPVTWGELFTIQPFGNTLVSMTLTGAQIERLLEQQWQGQPYPRVMKPSGLTYAWNPAAPVGARVEPADVLVNGQPLDLGASYSVTVNSFMADGGDNFTVLREGTGRGVGPADLDALVDYVRQLTQPFNATIEGRITTR